MPAGSRPEVQLLAGGDPTHPGDAVPPGFLSMVSAVSASPVERRGGRRRPDGGSQLARWIADRDNPLTARVIVNRLWQHHFGEGLVRTPDNFGALSEPPTHPELLDWLAANWSTAAGG